MSRSKIGTWPARYLEINPPKYRKPNLNHTTSCIINVPTLYTSSNNPTSISKEYEFLYIWIYQLCCNMFQTIISSMSNKIFWNVGYQRKHIHFILMYLYKINIQSSRWPTRLQRTLDFSLQEGIQNLSRSKTRTRDRHDIGLPP